MGSWTPECQKAFDKLKTALTTAPILRYPDFSSPFRLATDASDDGLGAVLTQLDDKKVEHVIGYASRALNNAECHYSVTERECLGVVWAVKHYHFYLVGTHFTPLTDHSALKWLIALKDPNGKFARWALSIQEYDFEVVHRPGRQHKNADAMSRYPVVPEIVAAMLQQGNSMLDGTHSSVQEAQRRDPELTKWISYLENKTLPENPKKACEIVALAHTLVLDDGVLYHTWWPTASRVRDETRLQLVIPKSLCSHVLYAVHDDSLAGGHLGVNKTHLKLREHYWWPTLWHDTKHWIESCTMCASRKSRRQPQSGKLCSIPVRHPFQIVGMDIIGPLPTTSSGKRYILIFTDHFTK